MPQQARTLTQAVQLLTAGEHILGPATIPTKYSWAQFSAQIPTADYENPANSFDLWIDVSYDGGQNWKLYAALAGWVGGRVDIINSTGEHIDPDPSIGVSIGDAQIGQLARARLVLRTDMNIGLTLTLT